MPFIPYCLFRFLHDVKNGKFLLKKSKILYALNLVSILLLLLSFLPSISLLIKTLLTMELLRNLSWIQHSDAGLSTIKYLQSCYQGSQGITRAKKLYSTNNLVILEVLLQHRGKFFITFYCLISFAHVKAGRKNWCYSYIVNNGYDLVFKMFQMFYQFVQR